MADGAVADGGEDALNRIGSAQGARCSAGKSTNGGRALVSVVRRGAAAVFPDLPAPSRTWQGFRPSIPDSLPVIGPSRGSADVLYAFGHGHGHIGLTLAPITAAIIADLVAGRIPPVPLTATSVGRF